ncbi:MAG: hypothetical protein LKK19_02460 [Bacteroidales bacterium]|jgi:hypothetical protein|nr:hypothetical protein [Bacteroidales bacterium]MCI2121548.1 hypothetical protein [Bacteroidales bacterium]MCI2145421.1 hypothetical protein [Bacteroidales bacterium]
MLQAEKDLFGYGETEREARESFPDTIDSKKDFLAFPFFDTSSFVRELGIKPSLKRKYKRRIAFAGDRQKNIIQRKYNAIMGRFDSVKFQVEVNGIYYDIADVSIFRLG